jgi:hypothetical protein
MLAGFVREVLATGSYESLADVSADVKKLAARRKIPIGLGELDEAFHRIAAHAALAIAPPSSYRRRMIERGGTVGQVTKAEAAAIVVELARRFGA